MHSVDLTLANEFRYFTPGPAIISVREETNYKDYTTKVMVPDGQCYTLLPGQSCLAITRESIKLAPHICGLLGPFELLNCEVTFSEGRSRFARLGLFVHITASFINPGIDNQQVLEIYNSSLVRFFIFANAQFTSACS